MESYEIRPVCLAFSTRPDVFKLPHVVAGASTSFFLMANILLCGHTTFRLVLRQITGSPPTPPYISHFPGILPPVVTLTLTQLHLSSDVPTMVSGCVMLH